MVSGEGDLIKVGRGGGGTEVPCRPSGGGGGGHVHLQFGWKRMARQRRRGPQDLVTDVKEGLDALRREIVLQRPSLA